MKGIKLTVITCLDCGIQVTVNHPKCKRCDVCRPLWRKQLRKKAAKKYQADKPRYNAYSRDYTKRKALENPEKYKAKNSANAKKKRQQREQDPEKAKSYQAYMANYFQENKKELMARNTQWAIEHPEAVKMHRTHKNHNRRAKEAQAVGKWKYKDFLALCEAYDNYCCYCHKQLGKLTADHMIPISRGGANTIDNIIPVCLSCNSSKHDKTLLEFMPMLVRMNRC